MKFLKIYGMHRTGTNYLEWILKKNCLEDHVFMEGNVIGWKHGNPPEKINWNAEDWDYKIDLKTKKRYMESIAGLEQIIQQSFDNDEIIYLICVRNPYSLIFNKKNKCEMINSWNLKYTLWIDFYNSHKFCAFIKHEELISNNRQTVEKITKKFSVKMNSEFIDQPHIINSRQIISEQKLNHNFYNDKKYLCKITNKEFKEINDIIDPNLMEKFEYKYEHKINYI